MSVERTLDRLSYLLRSAPSVPLSASAVVNRAELLALVEQALADLPAEVDEAHALLARRDQVLDAAQRQADAVVADARRRADELVENSAVVFRAKARANEIVAEAEQAARTARRDADDWCDRRLGALEAEVERVLGQLRRGRLVLEQRIADSGPVGTETVIDLRDGRRPARHQVRRPGRGTARDADGAELGTPSDLQ